MPEGYMTKRQLAVIAVVAGYLRKQQKYELSDELYEVLENFQKSNALYTERRARYDAKGRLMKKNTLPASANGLHRGLQAPVAGLHLNSKRS